MNISEITKDELSVEIKNPQKYWRDIIGALRFFGNTVWPKLSADEKFDDWSKEEVIGLFARGVDALRSVYFPIIPKDDKSSYWELYWKASKLMKSKPPADPADWDAKRKQEFAEARGQGMGVGEPAQQDGGVNFCVCPECGTKIEHERGIPCLEQECTKCGTKMIGADEEDLDEGVQPAFGSPGGKRLLASVIVSFIPDHKKYVEPFIGGGAVFFKKKPSESEVINDKDPEIAFAYQYIKQTESFDPLTKMKTTADRPYFEKLLSVSPRNDIERFHKHLYLLHFSFGLGKQNYAPSKEASTMNSRIGHLGKVKERLEGVSINNKDFRSIIKENDGPDTFFYFDLPYPEQQGKLKTDLTNQDIYEALKSVKGKWIMSNSGKGDIRKIFKEFNQKNVSVRRTFNMKTAHVDEEVLIANFPLVKSNTWMAESIEDLPLKDRISMLEIQLAELKEDVAMKKIPIIENLSFPVEIHHNGKKYVIKETQSKKLVMN